MITRPGNILDLGRMTEGATEFLEMVSPNKKVDTVHLNTVLYSILKTGIVLVAEDNGEMAGAIGGLITPNMWFPDELELNKIFWLVSSEYRGSSAGLRLLKAFVKHGKDEGVNRIVMSDELASPLNDDVYIKRGFKLKQRSFIMEV